MSEDLEKILEKMKLRPIRAWHFIEATTTVDGEDVTTYFDGEEHDLEEIKKMLAGC